MKSLILLILSFCLSLPNSFAADANAKLAQPSPVSVPHYNALKSDVETLDGIIAALYQVISGGVGEMRDWQRMRSLFIPEARIMAIFPKPDSSDFNLRILSLSDYIANSGPRLIEVGFREQEIQRKTEQWGELAQVYSSYQALEDKTQTVRRGINSLQLMHDGKRWWIISFLFEAERAQLPLPEAMTQQKTDGKSKN